jgi:hypothetical protein
MTAIKISIMVGLMAVSGAAVAKEKINTNQAPSSSVGQVKSAQTLPASSRLEPASSPLKNDPTKLGKGPNIGRSQDFVPSKNAVGINSRSERSNQ